MFSGIINHRIGRGLTKNRYGRAIGIGGDDRYEQVLGLKPRKEPKKLNWLIVFFKRLYHTLF